MIKYPLPYQTHRAVEQFLNQVIEELDRRVLFDVEKEVLINKMLITIEHIKTKKDER